MNKSTWVFVAILSVAIAGGLAYRHFAQELDSRGATRLMRALEENDTEKTEDLLATADIHARDKSGQTALFYAARHAQQPQIIHKLILAGADPLTTDKHGQTPLMVAAASNPNPLIIKVLARQRANSTAQQHNKDKALWVAAHSNTLPVIKMLLIANANPAVQDEQGRQAANYLAENTKLSEAEKTDLRQVMMTLEILDARERFVAGYKAEQHTQTPPTALAPSSVAKKPVEKKMAEATAEKSTNKVEKSTEKTAIKQTSKPTEKERADRNKKEESPQPIKQTEI